MQTLIQRPLVWFTLIFLSLCCTFLISRLEIRQNVQDMLPDSISRSEMDLLSRLGLINRVFITVEGPDFKTVSKSAERLGESLSNQPIFSNVVYKVPGTLSTHELSRFMDMLPAIVDAEDIDELDRELDVNGIKSVIAEDFLLLNSPAGPGLKTHLQHDPLGLVRFFLRKIEVLKSGSRMQIRGGLFTTSDGRACMLWAETRDALTDSSNAERTVKIIEAAVEEALLPECTVSMIGPLPHTLANSRMVNRELKLLLTLATISIVLLFYIFTRDLTSLLLVMIPLLSAPFAIVAAGVMSGWKISGIALAFGVVLIGIAVDFSVHIYMNIRNGKFKAGPSHLFKSSVMRSVFMAYLTTAGVFVVLMFSQIPAHRQMAFMAVAGLSVALLISILLVPDIAAGKGAGGISKGAKLKLNCLWSNTSACWVVLVIWGMVLVSGLIAWNLVDYDGDIRNFDVKSPDITGAEDHFRKLWGTEPDQVMVVSKAASLESALDLNDGVFAWLEKHGTRGVRSISPLLPGPVKQRENLMRWEVFWQERLRIFEPLFISLAYDAGFTKDAFAPFFQWLHKTPEPFSPSDFLLTPAGSLLSGMIRVPEKDQDSNKKGPDDVLVITLVPAHAIDARGIEQLKARFPGVHLFSGSGWKSETEAMMRSDIRLMCSGALILVTCIVWLFFRSLRMVAAALVPVVSALCVMAVYTVLSGSKFNMMHLLMGIMVTGLSIDYGIFMARAVRDGHTASTFQAVLLCAFSTISGFGILAFSHHPVLQSLGETVLAGIGASLPAAIFVTPCIMHFERGVK